MKKLSKEQTGLSVLAIIKAVAKRAADGLARRETYEHMTMIINPRTPEKHINKHWGAAGGGALKKQIVLLQREADGLSESQ